MKNITLIGMSGVGKTTVGQVLAMGTRQFIDTDRLVEQEHSQSLDAIIQSQGIEKFLQLESQTILKYQWPDHLLFLAAPGGSVVYLDETMEYFRTMSTVVYLKTTFEVISSRSSLQGRGVVSPNGNSFADVYKEREPLYEKWADLTVDANDSVIGVVLRILHKLYE